MTKSCLGRRGAVSSTPQSFTKESRGRTLEAGAAAEIMGGGVLLLVPHSLRSLLSWSQTGPCGLLQPAFLKHPGPSAPGVVSLKMDPPTSIINQDSSLDLLAWLILWRRFLNCDSFFSYSSSLHQVDIEHIHSVFLPVPPLLSHI